MDGLIAAYFERIPDPSIPGQAVVFGTSGHRGSSLTSSFNESHILAMTQAICHYRAAKGINGPLFLGFDTHALSAPAYQSALEVLAANQVEVMISAGGEYTPTPAVSHAILTHNRVRRNGLADGIVITPSHNPPEDGGFKYDPPEGGPAEPETTSWIERRANAFLQNRLAGVRRIPYSRASRSSTVHPHDFRLSYVTDLEGVLDLPIIRVSGIKLGVDPLGGAGIHYWPLIAERYGLDLTVVNEAIDPAFGFMTVDWDGRIRMDPSSPYAMRRLVGLKDRFDIAFACDTDHDRHGIVTRSAGLLQPNHFLSASIHFLFQNRPGWRTDAAVGKTVVSSGMIDRVARSLGLRLYETPVGFKWFVEPLLNGAVGFAGEESAGASFLRRDGTVWTTDKDAIVPALLAAEITARTGRDPGQLYSRLIERFGESFYTRDEGPATQEQKEALKALDPLQIPLKELAGERVLSIQGRAPGNNAPIGGVKVIAETGWFAARPSGTENIYKVYAESFQSEAHLRGILETAHSVLASALAGPGA